MERKWIAFGVSLILLFVLIAGLFFYFVLFKPSTYYSHEQINLVNPVGNMSLEEAKLVFNESFVYYLAYQIKAYELHNPPLSSDKPKIQVYVESESFDILVDNGKIIVGREELKTKDVNLRTTREEAIKMIQDESYVTASFSSGKSKIELIEDKTTLFSKGYLNMYNQLSGRGITGNVIKMYTD
jgi:hypothetical protein